MWNGQWKKRIMNTSYYKTSFRTSTLILAQLTCLLRNLYAGQEAAVRTRHGTMDWFRIGEVLAQVYGVTPEGVKLQAKLKDIQWLRMWAHWDMPMSLSLEFGVWAGRSQPSIRDPLAAPQERRNIGRGHVSRLKWACTQSIEQMLVAPSASCQAPCKIKPQPQHLCARQLALLRQVGTQEPGASSHVTEPRAYSCQGLGCTAVGH